MSSMEEKFEKACEVGESPGVVLLATDKSGAFRYEGSFGEKRPGEKMDLDATFILASCTKLMTSIAALQCVEQGLISLDEDLSTVVTELKNKEILTGFNDDGTAMLKPAETKITLRQLLTHTAGFAYESMVPILGQYRLSKGQSSPSPIRGLTRAERLDLPLVYEPGSSWTYGPSTDWVGVVVSRLSGLTLEEYMQKNIWDAIDAPNITFHYELKPNVRSNLVKMAQRGGVENPALVLAIDTGKPVEWYEDLLYDDVVPIGDEMGGQGATGNAVSYFKILESLLNDDEKLLKSETVKQMFTPQLAGPAKEACQQFHELDMWEGKFTSYKVGTGVNWGLAGIIIESDLDTGRKKGTLNWGGLPNLLWSIDRETGLALFYAGNLLPFGDQASHRYQQLFEKEMYDRLARLRSQL